jgi:hypothetical protein
MVPDTEYKSLQDIGRDETESSSAEGCPIFAYPTCIRFVLSHMNSSFIVGKYK